MQEESMEWIEIHYFTPTAFEKSGQAWPIRLGRSSVKESYHIGPRQTSYYSLHLVLGGSGTFIQNEITFELKPGDLFCLFPGMTHEYFTSKKDLLRLAWVAFDGKQGLRLCERIDLHPDYPHRSGAADAAAAALLSDFFDWVGSGCGANDDLAKLAHFYRFFGHLAQSVIRPQPKENTVPWVQLGMEYMQTHFAEGITIEEIARYAGVDRTHFSKMFRQKYGVPPVQRLQQLRINAAQKLLLETDGKLIEVAQSVGYPDVFSFSKAFKKLTGMSPSLYRLSQPARQQESDPD